MYSDCWPLCVLHRAEMEMVKSNIEVLIKEGLGPRAEEDFLLAQNACLALVKLGSAKKVGAELQSCCRQTGVWQDGRCWMKLKNESEVNRYFFSFQNRGETAAEPFRLPQTHELFSRLSYLLVSGMYLPMTPKYWNLKNIKHIESSEFFWFCRQEISKMLKTHCWYQG